MVADTFFFHFPMTWLCMIIHNLCVIMQKPPKNSLKSRFSHFFCIIGLILHHFALRSGDSWLSSDLEPLVLLEYAISSISNQPKSKKSTKSSFLKIGKKWLSLGPRDPLGGRNSQISISTTFFRELNHSESFWAKKFFSKNLSKMTKSGSL